MLCQSYLIELKNVYLIRVIIFFLACRCVRVYIQEKLLIKDPDLLFLYIYCYILIDISASLSGGMAYMIKVRQNQVKLNTDNLIADEGDILSLENILKQLISVWIGVILHVLESIGTWAFEIFFMRKSNSEIGE